MGINEDLKKKAQEVFFNRKAKDVNRSTSATL